MKKLPPVSSILRQFGACQGALDWLAANQRPTFLEVWNECPRGDWLIWLAARAGIDRRLIVLAACDCAETSVSYVPASDERPRVAKRRADGREERLRPRNVLQPHKQHSAQATPPSQPVKRQLSAKTA
jgi:hypothetical protein